jgi:hypothetical protein
MNAPLNYVPLVPGFSNLNSVQIWCLNSYLMGRGVKSNSNAWNDCFHCTHHLRSEIDEFLINFINLIIKETNMSWLNFDFSLAILQLLIKFRINGISDRNRLNGTKKIIISMVESTLERKKTLPWFLCLF